MGRLKEVFLNQCGVLESSLTALEYQIHEMRWELYQLRHPIMRSECEEEVDKLVEDIKEASYETGRF